MSEEQLSNESGAALLDGSLLDQILSETKIAPSDEAYAVAKQGVEAFIAELLRPQRANEKVDKLIVDQMIADIDGRLSRQLDEIIHADAFQKLESAWRGLKFSVDRIDFRENVRCELLNVSKEDLQMDFEDAPEVTKSGLYKIAYTAEYGQFGGKPYGAIVSNYAFGPGAQDVALLQSCASVAAMSHAPFFGAAGPQFFGNNDYLTIPNLKDLKSIFEGPQYAKWQAFRESEDARNVGLVMPRFLLR